uniref:Ornithine decarboxylase n=1 Tax=Jaculus jaculus TaxID=51337 RepID=A0A8C5KXL4_JACJA
MSNSDKEEIDCHILDEGFTAKDILDQKINEVSYDDACYTADLKALVSLPFYAVKCNDGASIVNTLAATGTEFACASKTEIQLGQSLGVPPERTIYANPCKQVSQVKYAARSGVQMMTSDREVELMKVTRVHPKAQLVLRIATDDSKAVCRLSVKCGLNTDVIGVSFHVGCGCSDPETFVQVASNVRCVFDMGAEIGFSMYLLDFGGGFPGSEDVKLKFEEITSVMNPALDKYFPSDCGVRIVAQPGRYYVASAFTLAVNIIAKKIVLKEQTGSDDEDESNEQTCMYYVNDGVCGSFNCILCDRAHVKPLLQRRPKPDEQCYSSMHVGDWMLFENMGAYTVAAASTFNGFQRPTIYYVMSQPMWQLMKQAQKHGFPPEVEEQGVGSLPMSCAWESGMDRHPAACASTGINVWTPFL